MICKNIFKKQKVDTLFDAIINVKDITRKKNKTNYENYEKIKKIIFYQQVDLQGKKTLSI